MSMRRAEVLPLTPPNSARATRVTPPRQQQCHTAAISDGGLAEVPESNELDSTLDGVVFSC
jgi:hypothetical protein